MRTLSELKILKESENRVEFKKGEGGNVAYDGGGRTKPNDRRRCILGYVIALCNELGGCLVIGMHDAYPHAVIGTQQCVGAIGQLEADIYSDTSIRTTIYELFEDGKRVLVIDVPSRPLGRVFKFEDVALMRVGEELKPMSDEVYLKIIQEQEPDFSEQICDGVAIKDLDNDAVKVLKTKYAKKQKNEKFLTLPDHQVLSDLGLVKGNRVTNAAVILVGKEAIIKKRLPQSAIMLEYRSTNSQIHFDNRYSYTQPFYLMIDKLWSDIDFRNGSIPIKDGPYIFDIPYFNEEVVREAVNNAIAHRDYRRECETVIKQFPQQLEITNIGGFPLGVDIDNLLRVPSTPRNRLLTDVLSKTGIVERSGQGVDKIFYYTLSEGKPMPDYSKSDKFQVSLILSAVIEDKAFALFIESVQQNLTEENKLSVFEIVALNNIRNGYDKKSIDGVLIKKLLDRNLIEKRGKTSASYYILCRDYFEFSDNKAEYYKKTDWNISQAFTVISNYLEQYQIAKMKDFVMLFDGQLTRKQVRLMIMKLVEDKMLISNGISSGTHYTLSDGYNSSKKIIKKAVEIGLEQLRQQGEI